MVYQNGNFFTFLLSTDARLKSEMLTRAQNMEQKVRVFPRGSHKHLTFSWGHFLGTAPP